MKLDAQEEQSRQRSWQGSWIIPYRWSITNVYCEMFPKLALRLISVIFWSEDKMFHVKHNRYYFLVFRGTGRKALSLSIL